jgi:transposase
MLTQIGDSQSPASVTLLLHIWEDVAMGAAIALRSDFDGATLRRFARRTPIANQVRRLLALAEIYDGSSRSDAARVGGVALQIVRDWVVRFNTRGPDGLINGKAPGRRPKLADAQREALVKTSAQLRCPEIQGSLLEDKPECNLRIEVFGEDIVGENVTLDDIPHQSAIEIQGPAPLAVVRPDLSEVSLPDSFVFTPVDLR